MEQKIRVIVNVPPINLATFSAVLMPFLRANSAVIETESTNSTIPHYSYIIAIAEPKFQEFKIAIEHAIQNKDFEIIYL